MRPVLPFLILALAAPACARYGPADPSSMPAPVTAPVAAVTAARQEPDAPLVDGESAALDARALIIPVAGVRAELLRDTYGDGRDAGTRQHRAIDIMAPHGTPILAADAGRILRLSTSTLGGITIYATDPDERFVYYYAHLQGYSAGLVQGMTIARGDTLGFVGSTGNASPAAPHLHFQVMRMPADRRYWSGEPINPFPVLAVRPTHDSGVRQAGAAREGPR